MTAGRMARGHSSAAQVSVTISIGVAERQGDQRSPEEVIKAADQALYGAKKAGRNCVRVHGSGAAQCVWPAIRVRAVAVRL